MQSTEAPCTCGHVREAHEHYRRGSDCGVCGKQTCRSFVEDARMLTDSGQSSSVSHVA